MNTTNIHYKIVLLGNLEPLSFTSMPSSGLVIKIYYNGTTFTYNMCPDIMGKGSFDLQGVIKQLIESAKPDWTKLNIYRYYSQELPAFDITVKNGSSVVETHNLKVVDAGIKVDALNDQARVDWLSRNFLTWQPTELKSKWHQPQYLSYVATKPGLKWVCKSYFADKDPVVETLKPDSATNNPSLTVDELSIVNVQFHSLFENKEQKPYAFDIYICDTNNTKVSYTQRYVYDSVDEKYQDLFLYKNSLGGYDTLLMKGKRTEVNTAESELTGGKVIEEFNEHSERVIRKNSGYMTDLQVRTQLHEFILSKEKYFLSNENVFEVIVMKEGIECESNEHDLTQMTFSFMISRDTNYLNLSRIDLNENPLVISAPDGSIHSVAPRLLDFPDASADSDPLILMQYKTEEGWRKMSYGALLASIGKNLNIDNANHTHQSSDIRDLPIKQIDSGTYTVIEAGSIERLKLSDDGFITSTAEEFELTSPNLDTSFIADKFNARKGFYKNGTTDSHILLGGGGHKAVSDFATSGHTHSYSSISSKPTTLAGYGITDAANKSHTHNYLAANGTAVAANRLTNVDNRNIVTIPVFYSSPGLFGEFKTNAIAGISDGGSYTGLLTYRKYGSGTDFSGGKSGQLAFTDNSNIWCRFGTNETWESWKKIYHSGNCNNDSTDWTANNIYANKATISGGINSGQEQTLTISSHEYEQGKFANKLELGDVITLGCAANYNNGNFASELYLGDDGISGVNCGTFEFNSDIYCARTATLTDLTVGNNMDVAGTLRMADNIYGVTFSGDSVDVSSVIGGELTIDGGGTIKRDLNVGGDVIAYSGSTYNAPATLEYNPDNITVTNSPTALDILIEKINRLEKQNEHLLNEINNLKNR